MTQICFNYCSLHIHYKNKIKRYLNFLNTFCGGSPSSYHTIFSKEIASINVSYTYWGNVFILHDRTTNFHNGNIIGKCPGVVLGMHIDLAYSICSLVGFICRTWMYTDVNSPVWGSVCCASYETKYIVTLSKRSE